MGLDINDSVALNAGVVVPRRPPEQRAIHVFEQVVHGVNVDRRLVRASVEGAEQFRVGNDHLCESCDRVVASGHDVHRERPTRGYLFEIRESRTVSEPGFVGQYMEPCRVQAGDGAELRLVPPRKDDDVPAPLLDQCPLRGGGLVHPDVPVRRPVVPRVERTDQSDEGVALQAGTGVEMDGGVDPGVLDAQRERGVEVAGLEKEERVHDRRSLIGGRDVRPPEPQRLRDHGGRPELHLVMGPSINVQAMSR